MVYKMSRSVRPGPASTNYEDSLEASVECGNSNSFSELPIWLRRELRSDHAGEFGAVVIYQGILAVSKDPHVQAFARHHILTERRHLELFENLVPIENRTCLLRLWFVMGWMTGALPTFFGRQAVFATIEAVETFVDRHYQQQIDKLEFLPQYSELRQYLTDCQADELSHRDEALRLQNSGRGIILSLWCLLVGWGSGVAVSFARRF